MSRFKGLAALFVAAAAALPVPAQTTLRWRFDKGKPFYVEWKAHKEEWQSWLGQDRHAVQDARIVLRLTPLEVRPDGGVVLEMRILVFTQEAPGPDQSQRALEGSTLRVTLDERLHAEEGRNSSEEPHIVEISRPFYLGIHEVTVGQFRQFVKETGHITDAERHIPPPTPLSRPGSEYRVFTEGTPRGCSGFNPATKQFEHGSKFSWKDPGFAQADEHPVCNVTWHDAAAFCAWLSKKEGNSYRLPTEAEWECACRAGTTTRFQCGDDAARLIETGNVFDAAAAKQFPGWGAAPGNDGYAFTAPVGKFKPNAFGLNDMHGNVCEWCADWESAYDSKPALDPQGQATGARRVARGGNFADCPRDARSARRFAIPAGECYPQVGLRVLLCVPAAK
jgi:formylglycine-generating enzyme required for sulfatase activity